eukprot:TRINITY_DN7596_c0_g1_i10.p1 TRINITY_DN7596_c0_g1~~TRINITY_DN7596_c0_g1_i10.p1  ORF type:complete len:264 (-),score=36.86 TRINITY_DN7596_c0_g1_i10:113-904(-)
MQGYCSIGCEASTWATAATPLNMLSLLSAPLTQLLTFLLLATVVSAGSCNLTDNRQDCVAILDLYYATNGMLNWSIGKPICTWPGISCSQLGIDARVTQLNLGNLALQGYLPDTLGMLDQLQALNVSHNSLSGSIPDSIGNCSQLESLDLSHDQFTGEVPASLSSCSKLTHFAADHNSLTSWSSHGLCELIYLGNLSKCDLSEQSTFDSDLSLACPLPACADKCQASCQAPVSYTHLRAHETPEHLVCRLLLEKKKKNNAYNK